MGNLTVPVSERGRYFPLAMGLWLSFGRFRDALDRKDVRFLLADWFFPSVERLSCPCD